MNSQSPIHSHTNKTVRAPRFAVLSVFVLVLVSLGAIIPQSAVATDMGNGLDVQLAVIDGLQVTNYEPNDETMWFGKDVQKKIRMTVTNNNEDSGSLGLSAATLISFFNGDSIGDHWLISGVVADAKWGVNYFDEDEDGRHDGIIFEDDDGGIPPGGAVEVFEFVLAPDPTAVVDLEKQRWRLESNVRPFTQGGIGAEGYILGTDITKPTITAAFDDNSGLTGSTDLLVYHSESNTDPAITLTLADATSGLSSFSAIVDDGDPGTDDTFTDFSCSFVPGDKSGTCSVPMDKILEGTNDFVFTIVDEAGNFETAAMTIKVDRTAAIFSLTQATAGADGTNGWHKTAPGVKTTFLDPSGPDHAGVTDFTATWTGAVSEVLTPTAGTDVLVTPTTWVDGTSALTLTGSDNAHPANAATQGGLSIKLDRVAPVISSTFEDGFGSTLDQAKYHSEDVSTLVLQFSTQDSTSGLASFQVTGSNGFPATAINCLAQAGKSTGTTDALTCTVDLTGIADGTHTLTAAATDMAGNLASSESVTVKLDHVDPTSGPVTVTGGTTGNNGWFTAPPTALAVSPSDDRSGLLAFEYSWADGSAGGTEAAPITAPVSLNLPTFHPGDGSTVLSYFSTDNAHPANSDAVNNYDFKVDGTVPTVDVPGAVQDDGGDGFDCLDGSGVCELVDGTGVNAGSKVFQVQYDAADAMSGIVKASLLVERPYDPGMFVTEQVLDFSSAPLDSIAAGANLFEYVPNAAGLLNSEGKYVVKVRVEDAAGHVTLSDPTVVYVNSVPLAQSLTKVEVGLTVADSIVPTDDTVILELHARDITAGGPGIDQGSVRVEIVDELGNVINTDDKVTNGAGKMTISLDQSTAAAKTFTVRARCIVGGTSDDGCDEFVIGPSSTKDITWTNLVVGTPTFDLDANLDQIDVARVGESLTLHVPITWAHDDSVATGLLAGGSTIGLTKAGNGFGDADPLVPSDPTSGALLVGSTTELAGGVYEVVVSHTDEESLTLKSGGQIVGYDFDGAGSDDMGSSFTVPPTATAIGNWVGVVAGACGDGSLVISLANQDDLTDVSPGFVNEADTIRATIPVCYTANYQSGFDLDDSTRDPAVGATVALFVSHVDSEDGIVVDAAQTLADNTDAFLVCKDGDACDKDDTVDGVVTVDITKTLLDRSDLAGAYEITALPISAPGGAASGATDRLAQTVAMASDVADYADTFDATWTGVISHSLEVIGASDDTNADRWWFTADEDGDVETTDNVVFRVNNKFSHDGSAVPDGSEIGFFCPTVASLPDGPCAGLAQSDTPARTTTTVSSGTFGTSALVAGDAVFTVNPDELGLDFLPSDFRFQLTDSSAIEPNGLGDHITHASEAVTQEMLWTKLHLEPFNLDSDSEGNIGSTVDYAVYPFWYHDEDGDGLSFHADGIVWEVHPADHPDGAGFHVHGDLLTADGPFGIQLADAVPDGDTLDTQPEEADTALETDLLGPGIDGLRARFEITRGCDLDTGCSGEDINEAGYHRFTTSATDTPHGIGTDETPSTFEHLWTAVALDAVTDRLTNEVGRSISLDVQAYYAHDYEFAGATGDDGTDLTLAERAFTSDVIIKYVEYGPGAGAPYSGLKVPAGESNTMEAWLVVASPKYHLFGFEGVSIDGQTGQSLPLTTIYPTPVLERVWLDIQSEGAWDETVDGVDWNNDGDSLDTNLFLKDTLALRDDDVEIRAKLILDDGRVKALVDDVYTGYSFTSKEDRTGNYKRVPDNMPSRVLSTTAKTVVGQTDVLKFTSQETTALVLSTGAVGSAGSDVAYDGTCFCWTATIPAPNTLKENIGYDVDAVLQVTEANSADEATTPRYDENDAFSTTYTAILLSYVDAEADDGNGEMPTDEGDTLWTNWDQDVTYTVYAQWAHDEDGDGLSYIADPDHIGSSTGDPVDDAVLSSALGSTATLDAVESLTPGIYEFTLEALTAPGTKDYSFLAAAAPDPSTTDATQDFSEGNNPDTNTLAWNTLDQTAHFTGIALTLLGTPASIANVNEGITLDYEVAWRHDEALVTGGSTQWDFSTATGPTQRGITRVATGAGKIALASEGVVDEEALEIALVSGSAPHGITSALVPGDADHAAAAPKATWTRIDADIGTVDLISGLTASAGGYTNPFDAADSDDVFVGDSVVRVPATFTFAHGSFDTLATGSLVGIGGSVTSPNSGVGAAAFTSATDGWFLVEARGLAASVLDPATLQLKQITAGAPDVKYIGFDADDDGIA